MQPRAIATIIAAASLFATAVTPIITKAAKPPSVLYKCIDGRGIPLYTSRAMPGCVVVSKYQANPATPAPTAATFKGFSCKSTCAGHIAGYKWASERNITAPAQCTGNSSSFVEGCLAWAMEQAAR